MRVALDAMGGDHAPDEIVKGAVAALERDPELEILLVGDEARVRPLIPEAHASRATIRHAAQVIDMGESPVEALRRKPDTSVQRAMEALRDGQVQAVVSAGDTGGVVAAATIYVPRLKGVKRQGIAIPIPSRGGRALLIDVGANIYAKPIHLLQYAIMAAAYARQIMGIANPRVGILSVGEEEEKGNDLVKKARTLLSRAELNFVGNIEGQAIFQGAADVIVCDGFVGNVVLKVAEGLGEALFEELAGAFTEQANGSDKFLQVLGGLKKRLDYSSTGGAPLLGVQGSVVICHGRSRATAIANAISVATEFTKSGVNDRIVEEVLRVSMLHRVVDFFHSTN